ncbi:major facilitator superfamily domain-containing protein [Polychytrium aggregatum]|uniref:major facilitator superfamily domain-containing protein n=1 Tax=Polychytrium aggregatum TaxID=110093 RepID=UPI0022FEFEFB|nr:major facilitator superfamily domain-containing protein [Polychytrium aggregatum]KAI9206575.1 major facilitator superfamily domain-containing protein [Polychytrium aggregatum]
MPSPDRSVHNDASLYRFRRTISFAMCILAMSCAGTIYLFSLYGPQLTAKLHYTQTQTTIIATLGNYGQYLGGAFWGSVTDRHQNDPKRVFFYAAALLFSGYSLLSATYAGTIRSTHYIVSSFFSFLVGFGSAALYHGSMGTNVRNWPTSDHGFAVGIPVSFLGLSAFIFSQLASLFFYSHDGPDKSTLDVAGLLAFLGIATSIVALCAAFLLKDVRHLAPHGLLPRLLPQPAASPETQDLLADGPAVEEALSVSTEPRPFSVFEAILLTVTLVAIGGSGLFYVNTVGSIVLSLTPDQQGPSSPVFQKYQNYHVKILSVCSCIGRLLTGIGSDWLIRTRGVDRLAWVGVSAALMALGHFGGLFVRSLVDLWAVTIVIGLAYGCINTAMPVVVSHFFGARKFATNWGWISTGTAVGAQIFGIIFGIVYDAHQRDGICVSRGCYIASFAVSSFASALGIALTLYLYWKSQGSRLTRIKFAAMAFWVTTYGLLLASHILYDTVAAT